jgi:hypothetical protein
MGAVGKARRSGPGRKLWETLGVGVSAVALVMCVPAGASAANFWYADVPPTTTEPSSQPVGPLQSVYGYADGSNHKVEVGISNYAGLQEGWGYSCHQYAASHIAYANIRNPHSVWQRPMQGYWSASNVC